MANSNFDDVADFHQKFGLPYVRGFSFDDFGYEAQPAYPTKAEQNGELMQFRLKFLKEELAEFQQGLEEEDVAQMADALVDLVYVALGTAHFLGLPWQELWDDVQRANMTKERAANDGSNSKRGSSFDVVKPEGWVGPETHEILRANGFDL